VYDFFPNYNFNSITNRFIRSPIRGGDVPRESMPKPKMPFMYGSKALNGAYANVFQMQQHFVGLDHFVSLVRVLGRTNLPLLVGECLENLNLKIQNVLVPYVRELFVGMPPSTKLPMFFYGTSVPLASLSLRLSPLTRYSFEQERTVTMVGTRCS
jgi:cytoplasmic FMR1 interacting protein